MSVTVGRNERGAWCVFIDGEFVSDHSSHDAARNAARLHPPAPPVQPSEGDQPDE